VSRKEIWLMTCKLQILEADKLSPAKTIRTIGMACLTLGWEKQNRFSILVLHPRQPLPTCSRDVELQLTCVMRVELLLDFARLGRDRLGRGFRSKKLIHLQKISLLQHSLLRKGELEHGIVRHTFPVD